MEKSATIVVFAAATVLGVSAAQAEFSDKFLPFVVPNGPGNAACFRAPVLARYVNFVIGSPATFKDNRV